MGPGQGHLSGCEQWCLPASLAFALGVGVGWAAGGAFHRGCTGCAASMGVARGRGASPTLYEGVGDRCSTTSSCAYVASSASAATMAVGVGTGSGTAASGIFATGVGRGPRTPCGFPGRTTSRSKSSKGDGGAATSAVASGVDFCECTTAGSSSNPTGTTSGT